METLIRLIWKLLAVFFCVFAYDSHYDNKPLNYEKLKQWHLRNIIFKVKYYPINEYNFDCLLTTNLILNIF